MTSYWKPRWPNRVLFGSYRDLNYRIDIITEKNPCFRIRTQSGPGFTLGIHRAGPPAGFAASGEVPPAAQQIWLSRPEVCDALAHLLEFHFSRLEVQANTIDCYCCPAKDDILPEGSQLNWALSLIHLLWSAIPPDQRKAMRQAEFMG
jgi:hypothetical protein